MTSVQFTPHIEKFLEPGFRLIEAGAGSGKTFNLELIVLRLIAEKAKRVGEIVLVTFTDAAALEMRQRVRARLKSIADGSALGALLRAEKNGEIKEAQRSELTALRAILAVDVPGVGDERLARVKAAVDELYRLRITTIHGFCQHVLSEHGPNHGFPPLSSAPVSPAELNQEIAEDWYRSQAGRWPLGECVQAVKALMADPRCDVRLLFRSLALDENDPRPAKRGAKGKAAFDEWYKRTVSRFDNETSGLQDKFRQFVATRQALSNMVTFDDLILRLRDAVLEGSDRSAALTRSVRSAFTCCLIDEFQDTDDAQWSIFSHLFLPRADDAGSHDMLLVAVGDPKQAIYGFRGADIRTYMKARDKASDGVVHTLDFNYRTDPSVISAFNQVFSLAGYFADPKLVYGKAHPAPGKGDKFKTEPIQLVPSVDALQAPREVARLLKELGDGGTVGVLVRNNKEADELHRQLVKNGLPAALESTQSVFSTQAAYLALLLLRALLHHEDVRARRALIYARPSLFGDLATQLGGGETDVELQAVDTALAAWVAKGYRLWTKHGFTSCWSHLSRIAPAGLQSVQQSLAQALFRSRLLVDFAHVGELLAARQRENLWDPHQLVAHLEGKIAGAHADDDGDAAFDESLRPESANPRVVVQTIHKSKGLEYGAVLLYLREGEDPDIGGTVLKTGCGDMRRLMLGSQSQLEELEPEALEAVKLQMVQENARLLYVAITRAKHRLVVMSRKTLKKGGPYGFHNVLQRAKLDPYSWSLIPAAKPGEGGVPKDWDGSLIARVPLSTDTHVAKHPPGLVYDKQADGLKQIPASLGATNFTALTKHQEFPKEYLSGQEDYEGGAKGVPPLVLSQENILLTSRAKGALFGVFVHELLDGLDFAKAALGESHDGGRLQDYVLARLVASGVPAAEDDPKHERMAAQVTESCKLWLSAPLPPIDKSHGDSFSLRDIGKAEILSEIRFALRSHMGPESVDGIKALFHEEFAAHYPKFGHGISPLAGVTMSPKRVTGLLTGVADLIFCHGKRFYIVDWKTNFLGNQVAQYDRATVDLEMAESFYHLQYSLYTAALDAYLAQSMGPESWSYDPREGGHPDSYSFGGVYYLFLRAFGHGGRGDVGCHHYRPTGDFIAKLRQQLASPDNIAKKS